MAQKPFLLQPVTLKGKHVRLEPLSIAHVPDLTAIALDPQIWQFMLYGEMHSEGDIRLWVEDLLRRQATGGDLPFVVRIRADGVLVGATRYLNIDAVNRNLEIGGTWYGKAYQRTGVNTETKYLLLRHAFEVLGCVRVQLKTDALNIRSQVAIERLGAVREGVLRKHMLLPDGRARDSVYYSILDNEWPAVKVRLENLMLR
jgi:N-acetyltransferase